MTGVSPELTKNQKAVLEALEQTSKAMTAYDILDVVRVQGIRAPVQVYRALEVLIDLALVHRIESMNAFIACAHEHAAGAGQDHDHTATVAFAICDDCGSVSEIPVPKANRTLGALAGDQGFVTERTVVELRGHCGPCRETLQDTPKADAG
ncbi:MAG: Fur family transcriptional regulator [Rhodospirillales bacterium]